MYCSTVSHKKPFLQLHHSNDVCTNTLPLKSNRTSSPAAPMRKYCCVEDTKAGFIGNMLEKGIQLTFTGFFNQNQERQPETRGVRTASSQGPGSAPNMTTLAASILFVCFLFWLVGWLIYYLSVSLFLVGEHGFWNWFVFCGVPPPAPDSSLI